MNRRTGFLLGLLAILILLWCICAEPNRSELSTTNSNVMAPEPNGAQVENPPDLLDLNEANKRYLFIGNSHTHSHDLPNRVLSLLKFHYPLEKCVVQTFSVGFIDEAARDPAVDKTLATRHWTGVILQAQAISSSGRFNHSTAEGIDLAKRAKETGAETYFFSEWGLQNVADSTARTDRIYRGMAETSGALLIPVGLVWEKVLQDSPDLALYDFDGNHQSALGADLTALVIACSLCDTEPARFKSYVPETASQKQWSMFCESYQSLLENKSAMP
jgi:hypothetical protein